jgi:HAD superfamily hydrolase (TIGR01484 family)
MRYLVLATDYDGTLAHDGVVDDQTVQAMERFIQSGRKLIMVTGRELGDLQGVFARLDLFERVVAENGAVLYDPRTREKRALAGRPPESFVENLRKRGVSNISCGDVIVATWHPEEIKVMEAIREAGLELQIIFN